MRNYKFVVPWTNPQDKPLPQLHDDLKREILKEFGNYISVAIRMGMCTDEGDNLVEQLGIEYRVHLTTWADEAKINALSKTYIDKANQETVAGPV